MSCANPHTMSEKTLGRYNIITIQTVFYLQAAHYSIQKNTVTPKCVQKKKDLQGKNKCLKKAKN